MISALLLVVQQSPIAALDVAAQKRDLPAIRRFYGPSVLALKRDPMTVINTGGAFGVGSKGWRVKELIHPLDKKHYAVFTTPLTSEDIGERVFELSGGKLVRYVNELDTQGWSIQDHSFSIAFNKAKKGAMITDDLKVTGGSGPLMIRLSPNYTVKSCTTPFAQAGGVVAIAQRKPGTIHLMYSGVVDQPNYAGSITDRYASITNDYWYPILGRRPAPYTAKVMVPSNWRVVAQGELKKVDRFPDSDAQAWTYRMDLPCTYFSLCAGSYNFNEDEISGRKFRTWSFRMTPEQMKMQSELYAPIIDFYSKAFATYPFSGYGVVDQPGYGAGMFEAYSFNTAQEGIMPQEEPHEPAHTWWGGIRNNSYLKSFWNESFATYCEGLYGRNSSIGSAEDRAHAFIQTPVADGTYDAAPLSDSPADLGPVADSLGYGKGGYVLQMLENEIGTERMLAAMRKFANPPKPGQSAEWEDFEASVGLEMKWFFDEWVRRPGYAKLNVADVAYTDGGVKGRWVFTGQPYRINLEVMLEFADGRREFVRADTSQPISIAAAEKPVLVSFDPWVRVLRDLDRAEVAPSFASTRGRLKTFRDPQQTKFMPSYRGVTEPLPADLDGCLIVGSPETLPAMAPLCEKVGFKVTGSKLTYKSTTVDLNEGAAFALVDLGGGKQCGIVLGATKLSPEIGRARVAVVDKYGRFLAGQTEPKRAGKLVFKL